MRGKIIYTLGTDRRSREDFIEILLGYEVEAFLDVRGFPRSKSPLFHRDTLEQLLPLHGIEYHYLGRELGSLREGGYTAYIITEEFRQAIEVLEGIADGKVTVIACAERLPWKCHRKWIARELQKRGWIVRHIIEKGKVWEPK